MQGDVDALAIDVHAIQTLDSVSGLRCFGELDYDMTLGSLYNMITRYINFDDFAKSFKVAPQLLLLKILLV